MATSTTQDTANDTDEGTVAKTTAAFSPAQLRDIRTFEDAARLAQEQLGATVVSSESLGDGFTLYEDKEDLVGLPMMFISWSFSQGDFGSFVAARVLVQYPGNAEAQKYVITDGSTGIYQQLKDLAERGDGPQILMAPRGLRKSEYTYTDDKGEKRPAVTYYIDTAGRTK